MKVLGTDKFLEKFKTLVDADRTFVASIIDRFSKLTPENFDTFQKESQVLIVSKDIFVYKLKDFRLFYTKEKKDQEEIILFIDIAKKHILPSVNPLSSNDPRYNSNINPSFNSNINPKYNSNISPLYNSNVNPKYNSNINPSYNSNINPRYNANINPLYNASINPKFNANINPMFNSYINPRTNPAFSGPIVYNLDLNPQYFIIRATDNILLFYDFGLTWKYFAVKANDNPKIFVVFDINNEMAGHMVSNGAGGFNYFNLNNDWKYFINQC